MENISKQITNIQYVASAMDNFLRLHMNGLKDGLKELSNGSLGKGVGIINRECTEIISKSSDAMTQIHETLRNMVKSFNQSVNVLQDISIEVQDNMTNSVSIIQNLSATMDAIKQITMIQSENFNQVTDFTTKVTEMQDNTMKSAEVVIHAVSELVTVSAELEEVVKIKNRNKFLNN